MATTRRSLQRQANQLLREFEAAVRIDEGNGGKDPEDIAPQELEVTREHLRAFLYTLINLAVKR